jgi:hypothetical protein
MSNRHVVGGLGLALSLSVLMACGGSSSPAQPAPVLTPTPVPQPTPTPPALSVIPPCPLPPSNPGTSASCTKPKQRLTDEVYAAIDRAIMERPDLFDLSNVNGGPKILDVDAYMSAVVAALGEAGLCGHIDPEGEISVKAGNFFSEHWIIASRVGWGVPTDHWVQRKYVGICEPSVF